MFIELYLQFIVSAIFEKMKSSESPYQGSREEKHRDYMKM